MKIRVLPVEHCLGMPLSHDLTQIVPASGYKGARFKKGQIVREEDLPELRAMGREHLSILDLEPDEVHEDDAAIRLAGRLRGTELRLDGPDEGRCALHATAEGLLAFDPTFVDAINDDPDWILATLPPLTPVRSGERVAALRVLPLAVREIQVQRAEALAKPLALHPFLPLSVGLVTTGEEFRSGKNKDAFLPRLERKVAAYGGRILGQRIAGDRMEEIADAIRALLEAGANLVLCTGGMSVDADDVTPGAIRNVAETVVFRGVPVLPGSMLMLAFAGKTALVGAPACVVHDERTALDPLLDRLFAGLVPTEKEVRAWGVGGLCRSCSPCTYPRCGFTRR